MVGVLQVAEAQFIGCLKEHMVPLDLNQYSNYMNSREKSEKVVYNKATWHLKKNLEAVELNN